MTMDFERLYVHCVNSTYQLLPSPLVPISFTTIVRAPLLFLFISLPQSILESVRRKVLSVILGHIIVSRAVRIRYSLGGIPNNGKCFLIVCFNA